MSALQREALRNKIGIPPLPARTTANTSGVRGGKRRRDYTPVSWDKYFEQREEVKLSKTNVAITRLCHCTVVAIDLRGHGDTKTDDDSNLSAERLSRDVGDVINAMYGDNPPPILLMGHSMGGAIAVHISIQNILPSLAGLAVIDVVEGTALEALSSMQSFLRSRPKHFSSLEQGIEWSVRSGQISNVESAKVSVAGQLILDESQSRNEQSQTVLPPVRTSDPIIEEGEEMQTLPPPVRISDTIREEVEESRDNPSSCDQQEMSTSTVQVKQQTSKIYVWRIDLSKTESYWQGWFKNMSQLFLSCPVPKLLLLAGVDRLDRELTIGQMQGKFQMQVLPQCGHCVHEDAPDKVAEVIVTFLCRHKLVSLTDSFQGTVEEEFTDIQHEKELKPASSVKRIVSRRESRYKENNLLYVSDIADKNQFKIVDENEITLRKRNEFQMKLEISYRLPKFTWRAKQKNRIVPQNDQLTENVQSDKSVVPEAWGSQSGSVVPRPRSTAFYEITFGAKPCDSSVMLQTALDASGKKKKFRNLLPSLPVFFRKGKKNSSAVQNSASCEKSDKPEDSGAVQESRENTFEEPGTSEQKTHFFPSKTRATDAEKNENQSVPVVQKATGKKWRVKFQAKKFSRIFRGKDKYIENKSISKDAETGSCLVKDEERRQDFEPKVSKDDPEKATGKTVEKNENQSAPVVQKATGKKWRVNIRAKEIPRIFRGRHKCVENKSTGKGVKAGSCLANDEERRQDIEPQISEDDVKKDVAAAPSEDCAVKVIFVKPLVSSNTSVAPFEAETTEKELAILGGETELQDSQGGESPPDSTSLGGETEPDSEISTITWQPDSSPSRESCDQFSCPSEISLQQPERDSMSSDKESCSLSKD